MRSITLSDNYGDHLRVEQFAQGQPFIFQALEKIKEGTVVLDLSETAKLVAFLQGDTSNDDAQDPDGRMIGDVLIALHTYAKEGQATIFAEREYRVVGVHSKDGTKAGTSYRVHHILGDQEHTAVVPSEYFSVN